MKWKNNMETLRDIFDTYGRRARLQPTLYVILPLVVTIFVWVPSVYNIWGVILSFATSWGVLTLLTGWTREKGRAIEKKLYIEWEGKPTTTWLRRSDTNLDNTTKNRYFSFLEKNIEGWITPTSDEERLDMITCDSKYDSAVRWLLEYTRNTSDFPLVFKELISYGFRRNLRGMKILGITFSVTAILINSFLIYLLEPNKALVILVLAVIIGSTLSILAWLFIVTKNWVKDSAYAYARALLASCDKKVIK
jgi:hypothetical protein